MKSIVLISALASLVVSPFTNAAAAPSVEVRSEVVHFGDLDIARSPGAAALYQRLESTARRVCRDLDSDQSRNIGLMRLYRKCIRTAIGNAVASVNAPALTARAAANGIVVRQAPEQLARRN